jgi:hypothetical protein
MLVMGAFVLQREVREIAESIGTMIMIIITI